MKCSNIKLIYSFQAWINKERGQLIFNWLSYLLNIQCYLGVSMIGTSIRPSLMRLPNSMILIVYIIFFLLVPLIVKMVFGVICNMFIYKALLLKKKFTWGVDTTVGYLDSNQPWCFSCLGAPQRDNRLTQWHIIFSFALTASLERLLRVWYSGKLSLKLEDL